MSNEITNGCAVCGGTKKFPKSETCSRECSNVIKRGKTYETRTCPVCSTQFEERIKRERRFCSEPCRLDWQGRPENIAARMERTKEAVLEKYGVESAFMVKEIQEKAAEAMRNTLNEHGDERTAKIKATKLEKYGDENYNNMPQNRETKSEVHGDENYNNREKAAETMMDLYGETHAMKRLDFQEKAKETLMNNYGVDVPLKSEEILDRAKKTSKERYGVEYYSQTSEYKAKVTEAWFSKIESTKQYALIQQLNANDIELMGEFTGFRDSIGYKEYEFRCLVCSNEFKRKFCSPTIPICRKCFPSPTSPMTHNALRKALIEREIKFVENSRRHIKKYELDFVLEDHGIAIEFNGNYYHAERGGGKTKEYHLMKTKMAQESGLRLIHVFEDEIVDRPDVVISRILSSIGICEVKLGARKCRVVPLEFVDKRDFFEKNHIQGDAPSRITFGLMYENEIVSAMSFGGRRRALGTKEDKEGVFELIRFSSLIGYNVVGAFSKLLSYFITEHNPKEIATFADIGWSGNDPDRTVYVKNGFKFEGFSKPNYWYFKKGNYWNRHHRFQYRKDVVAKKVAEAQLMSIEDALSMKEWELAQLLGMDRIWDCGNMRFSWTPATK